MQTIPSYRTKRHRRRRRRRGEEKNDEQGVGRGRREQKLAHATSVPSIVSYWVTTRQCAPFGRPV